MALKGSPITVGTAQTTLVTMPSNKEGAVHGLQIGNTTGSNINISFTYTDSSASADVSFLTTTVSGNSTFTFSKPINLNGNDAIKASATQSGLVAIASVFEDTTVNVASLSAAGEYTATQTYNFGDLVTDGNGNTFLSTFDGNVNRGIDNSSAFQTFASKGDTGTGFDGLGNASATGQLNIGTVNSTALISDADGDLREVPRSGAVKTDDYTFAYTDTGNHIVVASSGVSLTIPSSTFEEGSIISVISTGGSTATVSSNITSFASGDASATATYTLEANGVSTLIFLSAGYVSLTGSIS